MSRNGTIMLSVAALIVAGAALRVVLADSPSHSIVANRADIPIAFKVPPEPRKNGSEPLSRPLFSLPTPTNLDVTGSIRSTPNATDTSLPVLLGIIIEANQRLAVVRHGGKIKKLHEADEVGPWTVRKIDSRKAFLRHGNLSQELFLDPAVNNRR
jgi:hypothetical protein